ncbi:MAG: peroxiredoxin [Proteobacteria bacterium]|nr:peroxiredoxin [Pseudomonadota bacterium]
MKKIEQNKPLPAFSFVSTIADLTDFASLKGENLVIYFYPKDNTKGCTQEGLDFASLYKTFLKNKTNIIGISRDSLKSHEKFREKYALPFALIADTDEKLCKAFEVIKEKNMYGKKVMGIERSTFLIDKKGIVRQVWRKVKVQDHVKEVLAAVKTL